MATSMRQNRRQVRARFPWLGRGTFGCTETQVQANTVAKQLTMLKSARRLLISKALPDMGGFERVGRPEIAGALPWGSF
jgi:hypothetical protein